MFLASKRYSRPLELWPFEYKCFEEAAGAVEELAVLGSRTGEGTLGSTLKIISNQLLDLVVTMHRRYEQQEGERKASGKSTKKNQKAKGKNIRQFKNGPKKGGK